MGEGTEERSTETERGRYAEKAHDFGGRAQKNCGGTAGKMGEVEEGGVESIGENGRAPAASVAGIVIGKS